MSNRLTVVALSVLAGLSATMSTTAATSPTTVTAASVQATRLVTVRDTQNFVNVGSPAISPDGQWVLYTRGQRDWTDAQLRTRTHIWRVRIDGTGARQLTFGDANTTSPTWFPDGTRVAFTSSRRTGSSPEAGGTEPGEGNGGNQVFVMYTDGGEAWPATKHEGGVSGFSISPDGQKILFTAQDPLTAEDRRRRRERDDPDVVDSTFRWSHLWYLDLAAGEEKRITRGDFVVSDPQWSPDSMRVAYVTRPTTRVNDSAWADVWVTDLAGTTRKLHENAGPDTSPRWSPDGRTLAVASKVQSGNTQWYDKLHLFPAGGGEPRVLLRDFDLDFSTPIWAPDGRVVYWSTGQGTGTSLFGVDTTSGELTTTRAPMRGVSGGFQLSRDGTTWVFSNSQGRTSGDLWAVRREASGFGTPVRLTYANPWLESEGVQLGDVETVRWTNSEGGTIEGVLTRPAGYRQGRRYPLIVNPHGGPSSANTEGFSSANQLLAANGFLVLQVNFRGSSNYGQQHLNANRNTWGILDYDDIMKGVDYIIEQGCADPDRMVAYGWSYGGYMTFWMSTQTDRFKLIAPGAGLTNLYSMYSTTDIPAYLGWFFGTPWDHPEVYDRLSPIRHVKNVTSTILIMHGANDARVPPTQAEEFYMALKDLGKDVTYVRYPRQGHGITETRLAMDRLRRYVCAFTHAVGTTSTTETCRDGVPVAEPDENPRGGSGDGIITVDLPWSAPPTGGLAGERLDRGTFN
ncbi:MAG TPA: S9 family peptidase [Vicinamibacterales bacterium]|nr:S9 family peptidase [Vicinamibacterales bacterium]